MDNLTKNLMGHGWESLFEFGERTKTLPQIKSVFEAKSMSQFTRRVSQLPSQIECIGYDGIQDLEEASNVLKGDLFELFTVMAMNAIGGDRAYLLLGVKWAPRAQPGFDFTATNKDGLPVMIQSKFRSNVTEVFESNQLETFLGEGANLGVAVQRVLFTNATKLSGRYRRFEREDNLTIIDGKVLKKHATEGFWKVVSEQADELFSSIS